VGLLPELLPEVLVSDEPPAPMELLPPVLPELPEPEAPIDVLPPLVDGSLLAVLPDVPLVEPEVPLVLGDALGLAVLLLPLGLVTPPDVLEPEPPVPDEPAEPEEPEAPDAPEPEPAPAPPAPPAPPEPWAIDSPPIARAAAAAKAVRVFLVVIMTYSLSGNPEGGG
jgi:hypothetical protein